MDINKAIRYVKEDERWVSKLLIGVLVSVFAFLIIPALFLQGYVIKIVRQVMNGDWDGLPEWDDWGKFLKDGFYVTVAQFIYTLPFILLLIIGTAMTGGMASVIENGDAAGLLASGGIMLLFCLMMLFIIALLFLTPALLIQYAIKDDFGSLFRVGEIMAIIRNNLADILIVFAVMIVAGLAISLVSGVLSLIPCLGWIAAVIIGLAVGPYISFVSGHLYGQIASKVLGNKAGGKLEL